MELDSQIICTFEFLERKSTQYEVVKNFRGQKLIGIFKFNFHLIFGNSFHLYEGKIKNFFYGS